MTAARIAAILACAAALLAVAPVCARAASTGDRLQLEGRCRDDDSTIAVVPDQWLSHTIAVEGSTTSVGTSGGTITVVPACRGDSMLTVRVPSDFPVGIDLGGHGSIRLGDLRGPVVASLRGDVGLNAGHLFGGLTLDIYDGGDVHVAAIDGPARLDSYGSGDLAVGGIMSPSLQTVQTGSGDMAIGGGRVGSINATVSGSGDLSVAALTNGGAVTSTGSGDITLARVTGDLTQTQTGSGDITIRARGNGGDGGNLTVAPPAGALDPAPSPRRHHADWLGDLAQIVLVLLLLLAVLTILLLRRRRGTRVAGPVDPRLAAAADRFEALARRIGRIEAVVTSHEFDLDRQFREMGD